ncbi:MAG: hypothetical protein DHS20C21_19590 [Gemmatimonadota bacterium]|nr:MAG: hypothetical protein DHS20C21_19590 [Gemmatimonadota bacterium]
MKPIVDECRAGSHVLAWDTLDPYGSKVAPGMFFVRAEAGAYRKVRKLIVLR